MEVFDFCLEIIRREALKFNVGINSSTASQITAATASDVNFDIAHNRCAFLYRCGAINLSFAKDCFKRFLLADKSIAFLLSKWINCPNLTVCSISKGPALDYIALMLSYQECGMFPSLFKNIKVISKYGAWRNTVNVMLQVLNEGWLKSLPSTVSVGNIEVIQGDPFIEFTQKVKEPICSSDVVIMMKTLNLQADGYNLDKVAKALQEFLSALKPGTILFCIDTKPSISVITQELCSFHGNFLFEPIHLNTMINLEHADFYKNIFGCLPVTSARGSFFVWQKSSTAPTSDLQYLMDEVSESVKRLRKENNIPDNDCSHKLPLDRCSGEQSVTDDLLSFTSANCSGNCSVFDMPTKNLKPVGSKSNDQQSVGKVNISAQNLECSSSSLLHDLLASNYVKEESMFTTESSCSGVSVNQAIQTEPENLKITGSSKISILTNRIAKLTTTLSEMLQTSELNACTNDSSYKNLESECNHPVLSDCIHKHSFSVASCLHKCQCANYHMTCKCCQKNTFENCCQNHLHQQGGFIPKQYNSTASLDNDLEISKYSSSCHNELKFSTENSDHIPKLVIPLNNISGNVVSQILSLISQSNQE